MRVLRLCWLVSFCCLFAYGLAQKHALLSGGPMLGYSEMTEVQVWVQTTKPAQVSLRYWPLGRTGLPSETSPIRTAASNDHIALFTIAGLEMGQRYEYELLIDNQVIKRDYPLEFQTQPHWRWTKRPAEPPEFKFAFGSCLYINDPVPGFDRPGNPYGGDYDEVLSSIHKLRPNFMVWLGDNTYYREMDWLTEQAMRARWRKDRSHPSLQPLFASTHQYAIWDDHDFGPNDSDRTFRLRDAALKIFSDYWPASCRGTRHTPGCFFRFEWADVEFFMLDDRYHRSPNAMPKEPGKEMLGKAQLQWLKESLASSKTTFKIVCNGGQMINPMCFFEGFAQFPDEQKELFDFIARQKINGVVFLSGDRHASELLKVQWPGSGYAWYEYTSSPLGAGAGRYEPEENNPARVPGTWVTRTRNFGLVQVSGKFGERKLTLTAHDKEGKELWKHEISEGELKSKQ